MERSPQPQPRLDHSDYLRGISVVSATDVWAVGYFADSGDDNALTERWDGSTWSVVPGADILPGSNVLYSVATVSSGDVWAVGYHTSTGNTSSTLTEHWNGTTWSEVSSPSPSSGTNELHDVVAVSTNDVWAVGYYYTSNLVNSFSIAEHWNGTMWSVVSSANPSAYQTFFNGVAIGAANDVWAVGFYGGSTNYQTLVERYNPCLTSPTPTAPPHTTPTATGTPSTCLIQFSDVPPGSTFYDDIRCLACRGIINGYSNGTFKPNNNVTRGQLSKIVSNSATFTDTQPTRMFQDVPLNSTFQVYIGRLASRGYINGYPCGGPGEPCISPANLPYFRPNNNASRGQISKIDSNSAVYGDTPVGQQFEDVGIGSTYYTYAYRLVSRSIMSGYPCGGTGEPCVPPANLPYFRPSRNATRGQTSKIVGNTFFPNCSSLRSSP